VRIQYSEEEQRRDLKCAFDQYRAVLSAKPSASEIAACAAAIADNVAFSASRFKHLGFKSEEEWRLILSSSYRGLDFFFRPSSRTVIPYTKTRRRPGSKLPIVSITIGPTLDQRLSWHSVLTLVVAKGYFGDGEVEIKASKLPLTRND